jgi:predicted lipoprotein with Yx(FWY)xxD motif
MTILRLVAFGALATGLIAACSSSPRSTPAAAPAPSSSAPPPTSVAASAPAPTASAPSAKSPAGALAAGPAAPSAETVTLARGPQGIFLIAPDGHSLYVFDKDEGTTSACTAGCAAVWPGLTAAGTVTTGPVVNKGEVGTADGQTAHQVTYYGHLLYEYKGDSAPGQTNGINIPGWHLLGPFGNVMLPRPST